MTDFDRVACFLVRGSELRLQSWLLAGRGPRQPARGVRFEFDFVCKRTVFFTFSSSVNLKETQKGAALTLSSATKPPTTEEAKFELKDNP